MQTKKKQSVRVRNSFRYNRYIIIVIILLFGFRRLRKKIDTVSGRCTRVPEYNDNITAKNYFSHS